jgi:hypothetical protein
VAGDTIYRVTFQQRGEIYEVYARGVGHGAMFGFVEIEGLVFGERSKIVIDSTEERLKTEFEGVVRTYVPIHAVIRIDQVDTPGSGRITSSDGTVATFPTMLVPPTGARDE